MKCEKAVIEAEKVTQATGFGVICLRKIGTEKNRYQRAIISNIRDYCFLVPNILVGADFGPHCIQQLTM